jgi:membrane protein YdbS with pleckstrin-like domain
MIFIRIIILLLLVALDVLAYVYLAKYVIVRYIVMGVITVVGVFFLSIYVPIYFKRLSFKVSKEIISKESGFFIKSTQTMKVSSIQYVTSIYIPLFRYIGFNFIIFNALGGYMIFNFLSTQDSNKVLQYINRKIT